MEIRLRNDRTEANPPNLEWVLEEAARKVGVRLSGDAEYRTSKMFRRALRITLWVQDSTTDLYRSRGGRVCWHGHREWMRAVYRELPNAVIITALIRYENAEHFEEAHEATRNAPWPRMICKCDDIATLGWVATRTS